MDARATGDERDIMVGRATASGCRARDAAWRSGRCACVRDVEVGGGGCGVGGSAGECRNARPDQACNSHLSARREGARPCGRGDVAPASHLPVEGDIHDVLHAAHCGGAMHVAVLPRRHERGDCGETGGRAGDRCERTWGMRSQWRVCGCRSRRPRAGARCAPGAATATREGRSSSRASGWRGAVRA